MEWMHIPKALNGFGLIPYIPKQFIVKNTQIKKMDYSGTKYHVPPVIKIVESSWRIASYKVKSSGYRLGGKLRLPLITSMDEWIERLNNKCPGFTDTQVLYASSTIPLPEIPYVSTSRVAAFAEMWGFNASPNISGSAIARTSRFISASLALTSLIKDWLVTNSIFIYV
jgi:hypothetical protein